MKKSLILTALLLLLGNSTIANELEYYCPKQPYNYSKGVGSFFTSVSGANLLTKQIAQSGIAKALKKELGSKFKVKIETFGGSNLINGKFKKLTAESKNIQSNGIHFSSIKAETVCGFNHIKYENDQLYFVENLLIRYEGKITQDDLKKTLESPEYVRALNKLSIGAGGTIFAKITNVNIQLVNNKLAMSYDVLVPMLLGSTPKHISFTTGLDVENGKIAFDNIDFGNTKANQAMQSALPLINKLNPLVYKVKTDNKNNATVNVKTVKIINNEIYTDGLIIIPANYPQN